MKKKVLVTGATKGIGKAIFKKLSENFDVYAAARTESTLNTLGAKGYCVCDLSVNGEKLTNYIKDIGFDIIINNAGEYIYGSIDKMSNTEIERIFHTNLIAPVKIISSATPYMKKNNWGRIINIGSISGVMGEANASLYSSTKAGLIGLTKALALELAEYNITVNTINPGWVDTELGNSSVDESDFSKEEILDCIPQKRFITPYEVSTLVEYLISDGAKGITGQSVNMCAGLSVGI